MTRGSALLERGRLPCCGWPSLRTASTGTELPMPSPSSISLSGKRKRWFPELLYDVSFRRYWTGQAVSTFGDQISFVVIPLVAVLVTHADAAQMGYLVAAGWLPHLL